MEKVKVVGFKITPFVKRISVLQDGQKVLVCKVTDKKITSIYKRIKGNREEVIGIGRVTVSGNRKQVAVGGKTYDLHKNPTEKIVIKPID